MSIIPMWLWSPSLRQQQQLNNWYLLLLELHLLVLEREQERDKLGVGPANTPKTSTVPAPVRQGGWTSWPTTS